ncbi:energy-coupling factor transporter ATP-binding protein EcfA2 [Moorella thermoacetica]|uniref:Energy-coupling factor transporter ATP-binding protein EcfA2 n=1 Tax=Neomoorella thermoacetica TaxID=1525 RepID=A0A1J5NKD0_NEOTH|nr:energy-coupling factor transporter ATP-binding protein EcfA2 [Moorella thermoacetica]
MEISLQGVDFAYQVAGRQLPVLYNIDLKISAGDFLALTGAGGSGKSTLAQIIAGLLEPTAGKVSLDGRVLPGRGKFRGASPWSRVGMAFQMPEQQLFAETVMEDVSFGPRNMGLSPDRVKARAYKALEAVGLDPETIGDRSPFTLSGGQRRRVALAGILAMEPEVLILDEPTAGLDPAGQELVLDLIRDFARRRDRAVVVVSHNMAEVAAMASQVLVLHRGRIALQGTPREIFRQEEALRAYGLLPPPLTQLMHSLRQRGAPVPTDVLTLDEARDAILHWLKA